MVGASSTDQEEPAEGEEDAMTQEKKEIQNLQKRRKQMEINNRKSKEQYRENKL